MMRMTMRWYGQSDPVQLEQIRQIPVVRGIVSALYDIPAGVTWPVENLHQLKTDIEDKGLTLDVIESIPVHDAIKLGSRKRDQYIEAYCESIRNLGKVGIHVLCYNFMPVFDWMRTDLAMPMSDGSTALSYEYRQLDTFNLQSDTVQLPGWGVVYSPEDLNRLLAQYTEMTPDDLFDNLVYFLQAITPVAREAGVKLAIHPDDPPWSIFDIPRIVSTSADITRLLEAVPDPHNGLTFCSGSFGAREDNDLVAMIHAFGDRINFVHLRNVERTGSHDFHEVAHNLGSISMPNVIEALVQENVDAPVRPDHGRMIWGEKGRAGYGLYDRALGAMYLAGIWEGLTL